MKVEWLYQIPRSFSEAFLLYMICRASHSPVSGCITYRPVPIVRQTNQ